MTHAMPPDHKGDYGIDGSFKVISARGQAIGIGMRIRSPRRLVWNQH